MTQELYRLFGQDTLRQLDVKSLSVQQFKNVLEVLHVLLGETTRDDDVIKIHEYKGAIFKEKMDVSLKELACILETERHSEALV
jgi:Iap family predicted aminopeptidase